MEVVGGRCYGRGWIVSRATVGATQDPRDDGTQVPEEYTCVLSRGYGRWALRQSTALLGAGNTMAALTELRAQEREKGTQLYVDAETAVHVPQMNFLMAVSVAKQQQQQHLFQKGHGTMHGLYSVGVGDVAQIACPLEVSRKAHRVATIRRLRVVARQFLVSAEVSGACVVRTGIGWYACGLHLHLL